MASLCPLPNLFIKEIASLTESTIFTDSLKSRNSSAKSSSVAGFVGKSARFVLLFHRQLIHITIWSSFAQLGRNSEAIFHLQSGFQLRYKHPVCHISKIPRFQLHLPVGLFFHEQIADSLVVFNNWYSAVFSYKSNQAFSTTGNDTMNIIIKREKVV